MKKKQPFPVQIQSIVEHKELKQDGYTIHYFTTGNPTKELVIFLHPAFADHRCFDKQIDSFAKEYRVVTLDMPGHGLSKMGKSKDKIDATVNHFKTIIQLEGYKRAHVVGVSAGSLIAQYFALKHADKILSLTVLGGYDINADSREVAKAQRAEQIKWILLALVSMRLFRKHVATVSVSQPDEQIRFYEMARTFTRKSFMVMQGLGNVIKLRENVKRKYPLLILCGDEDLELAQNVSKKWHESESASNYVLIAQAGHCANMDCPVVFNKIVMDFIKRK
jgi:3-oxoadipate enol-lactonase